MHIRVIVTESGAAVEVERVIFGPSKQTVEQRARDQLRQIIQQVLDDHPNLEGTRDIEDAVQHGSWWADLGSEEFSVLALTPEGEKEVEAVQVEITLEGGVIGDVHAPAGVKVVVRDYDTDGADKDRLQWDDDGRQCIVSTWEGGAP